jgi:hypothetical protein
MSITVEVNPIYIHLGLMGLILILLITLFRVCNRIGWAAMLTIAICGASLYVTAINSLGKVTSAEVAAAILRSEMYGAALGERNLVIQNREYRMTRVPKDEDDLDNDEVDLNPEIPV